MIKINLLDSYVRPGDMGLTATVGEDEFEEIKKQAILRILIILLPTFLMYLYELQHLPSLQSQINQIQSTIATVKAYNAKQAPAVSETKKFKEDEKKIQDRISALEKLSKDRSNEIKILHLIQQVIPEKAWLTNLEVHDGKARLLGLAATDNDISLFMESLSKSVMLVEVALVTAQEVSVENLVAKQFEISCTVEKM